MNTFRIYFEGRANLKDQMGHKMILGVFYPGQTGRMGFPLTEGRMLECVCWVDNRSSVLDM